MELLRIIAMMGILIVHSDFFAIGAPSSLLCSNAPIESLWRFAIESITIVSVNIFILISGWFGIHPKKKRLSEFIFQILFFNISLFLIFTVSHPEETLTRKGIESIFMLDDRFWFVKAYLMLYCLSPILNKFGELPKMHQLKILICFFSFQTIYGWLYPSVTWFHFGYSTISFTGLYLLSYHLRQAYIGGGGFFKGKEHASSFSVQSPFLIRSYLITVH